MQCNESTFAVVTGGASGLGAGTVKHLRALGCSVLSLDLPSAQAEKQADDMGAAFIACDVTSHEHVLSAVTALTEQYGIPRVLINCAGVAPAARTVSRQGAHSPELFAKTVAVNLIGSYVVASTLAARMAELDPLEDNERGVIINTASVAAYDGQAGQCAYAASKAGIVGLTLPLARDLASLGIRACAIAPGIFKTPMLEAFSEEVQQSLAAQVPFPKRLGDPTEFARLVQHIVENSMLNGEVIRLDGAMRMGSK